MPLLLLRTPAQSVLDLPQKIFAGLAAKGEFKRIALQITVGLKLPDLTREMGLYLSSSPLEEDRRVSVDGAEQVYAPRSPCKRRSKVLFEVICRSIPTLYWKLYGTMRVRSPERYHTRGDL